MLVIFVAVVAGSAWLARQHEAAVDELQANSLDASLIRDARLDGANALILLQLYVSTGDESLVASSRSFAGQGLDSLREVSAREKAEGDQEDFVKLDALSLKAADITKDWQQIIALRQGGDVQGATAALNGSLLQLQQIGLQFNAVEQSEQEHVAGLQRHADNTAELALWLLIASGAIGLALGIAALFVIARSILRPLSRLESAALAVAGGDLNARAPTAGPQELACLGVAVNTMTESLLDASKRRELEEALRLSEEHYGALVETMSEGLGVQDENGLLTHVNNGLCQMLGYTQKELMTRPITSVVHEDSLLEYERNMAERAAGKATSYELELKSKDGGKVVTITSGKPLFGPEGEFRSSFAVMMDITRRKRAEESLRESEEKFRTLVESAPLAIVITAREGTIKLVNSAAESMFGYGRGELTGKAIEVLMPERYRQAHTGECAAYLSQARTRPMFDGLDVVAQRKDGTEFPASCALGFVQTTDGPLAISFVTDITERKGREQALRESEERFRQLAENIAEVFWLVDKNDGQVLYVSPAYEEVWGRPCQSVYAQPTSWLDAVHPEDRDRVATALEKQGEDEFDQEFRIVRPDGSIRWVRDRGFPIRNELMEVYRIAGIAADISECKQGEEELRRLNQELQREQRQIEQLNRSLEQKVRERTRELELANQQLQRRHNELMDARAKAATDGLTGLANHRAFHERIREEVASAQAEGRSIGLIMLDIDGFKGINDSLGHLAGDQILRDLAATVAESIGQRQGYRYGGDEFAVMLPGVNRRITARTAERLRRGVERRVNGTDNKVTISLGVAAFPDSAASAEELIYGADAAMYWAKAAGKNRVGDWHLLIEHSADGRVPWYLTDRVVRAPDAVTALVAALAAKDPATGAHTERCSCYAASLAEELGLNERETSIVRLSSLLHDIGKLAVPDEVLFKPGPLNDSDWDHMRQHPVTGLHILSRIPSIASATPAVLHHHEHFDGSGYPDGLAAEEIPVASRILLVTDAFDAMTTDRPYRKAMPVQAAIEELKRNGGSQFDPTIVEAFLRLLSRYGAQPLYKMAAQRGGPAAGSQARVAKPR